MNKILLICWMVIAAANTNAQYVLTQDVTVSWGEKYKTKGGRHSIPIRVIGSDSDGFTVLRATPKGKYYLERHAMELKFETSKRLDFTDQGKAIIYGATYAFNGRAYLFGSLRNKRKKVLELFAQEINIKTLEKIGQPRKVAQTPLSSRQPYMGRQKSSHFTFRTSQDTSKILVYFEQPVTKRGNEEFNFFVIDENMNVLWQRDVMLPYADQLFEHSAIRVSNLGKVYILGKLKRQKGKWEKNGIPNYDIKLLAYDQGNHQEQYDIALDEYLIGDVTIGITNDEDIICAGFYSQLSMTGLKGVFYLTINGRTKEITNKSYKELSLEFITEGLSEKEEDKIKKKVEKGKDIELNKFTFDELILDESGGATLVGEVYFVSTHYQTVNNITTTYYRYHFGDMIVISISPTGQIRWATKVQKRQTATSNTSSMSYNTFLQGRSIYLLFNDNAKNYDPDLKQGTVYSLPNSINSQDQVVSMPKINQDGTVERKALFERSDSGVVLHPRFSHRIDADRILIYGEKSKTAKFGMLTFKY